MRITAWSASLGILLCFGALLVGHTVLIPLWMAQVELADPNLLHRLAQSPELRCADILLAGAVFLLIGKTASPRKKMTQAVTIGIAAAAALDRLFVLPARHHAWARVDWVTQLPVEDYANSLTWSSIHQGVLIFISATLLMYLVLARPLRNSAKAETTTPPPPA